MLDGNDTGTFYALRLLREVVDKRKRPIIIWAGAGVSKWCGFPSWLETAERFHSVYRKLEPKYDRSSGQQLIEANKLPELFELLRRTDAKLYSREIASAFSSRVPTPVYSHFLKIVRGITPLRVVTTNIDETLEHNLPLANTVQRPDLERCVDLLGGGAPFVAKLHGSASAVETVVFTTSDYDELLRDAAYLRTLERLFAQATVVFVGYGLRDRYVLDLFASNNDARPLAGNGPHFLVEASDSPPVPKGIKAIRYLPQPYADHRSAMTVLDIIRAVTENGTSWFAPENDVPRPRNTFASGYFISDITPAGTWTSSQSLVLQRGDFKPNAIIGQGFDDTELPDKTSPALHDLTVGLVSFDQLHVPLSCVAKLHDVLGSGIFWDLVRANVFRFIHFEREPVVMFRSVEAVDGGDVGEMHVGVDGGRPRTIEEEIRVQLHPTAGQEEAAGHLFEALRANASTFDHTRFNIPSLTRGALLHPSARKLLGISEAVLPSKLPRWSRFPVIRLAHTIIAGCACENFNLPATKIGFGSEVLVGAAFAVSAARDWADSVSSYVLTNRFDTELGSYVRANPSIWGSLLDFRNTQAGVNLRREILEQLATSQGGEFAASVNGGLRQIVPTAVMQQANDQLSGLLFRDAKNTRIVPAVWTNLRNSDEIARLWRARSRRELDSHCKMFGLRPKSMCPCDSGEKLRDCCLQSLSI